MRFEERSIRAGTRGIIGRTNLPLVNEGEGIFHIARFESTRMAEDTVEALQADELPSTLPGRGTADRLMAWPRQDHGPGAGILIVRLADKFE